MLVSGMAFAYDSLCCGWFCVGWLWYLLIVLFKWLFWCCFIYYVACFLEVTFVCLFAVIVFVLRLFCVNCAVALLLFKMFVLVMILVLLVCVWMLFDLLLWRFVCCLVGCCWCCLLGVCYVDLFLRFCDNSVALFLILWFVLFLFNYIRLDVGFVSWCLFCLVALGWLFSLCVFADYGWVVVLDRVARI